MGFCALSMTSGCRWRWCRSTPLGGRGVSYRPRGNPGGGEADSWALRILADFPWDAGSHLSQPPPLDRDTRLGGPAGHSRRGRPIGGTVSTGAVKCLPRVPRGCGVRGRVFCDVRELLGTEDQHQRPRVRRGGARRLALVPSQVPPAGNRASLCGDREAKESASRAYASSARGSRCSTRGATTRPRCVEPRTLGTTRRTTHAGPGTLQFGCA